MKPVWQDRFGKPDGNCFESAIASILEVELSEMPHLGGCGTWWEQINAFLRDRFDRELIYLDASWNVVPLGYHLINGMSPRGIRHSVVGMNGLMVHDPHPDATGLVSVDSFMVVVNPDWKDKEL